MEGGKTLKIVLNAEPFCYSPKAIQIWTNNGYNYLESSWNEINSKQNWPEVEILVVRLAQKIDSDILIKFPNLKKVVSATTGLDHIDIKALNDKGIRLISLRGHNDFLKTIPSTAEHTWALIMALIRNIPNANDHVKKGGWNRDLFRGIQLKNKTIGIVGFGRTGQKVAEYARAFNMKVKYYDPYVKVQQDIKINSLKHLFEQSDIITFHVHLNEETHHLLNNKNIQNLKINSYLINTSRGSIWDESAVLKTLIKKKILGIAIDVLGTELDRINTSPLWQAQQKGYNVIITPHIGGATWDAMWACEEYIANSFL